MGAVASANCTVSFLKEKKLLIISFFPKLHRAICVQIPEIAVGNYFRFGFRSKIIAWFYWSIIELCPITFQFPQNFLMWKLKGKSALLFFTNAMFCHKNRKIIFLEQKCYIIILLFGTKTLLLHHKKKHMTFNEFYKLIEKHGWRKAGGSKHEHYVHPDYDYFIPVGRHPSKEVPTGTLNKMLKDAGIKK